MATTNWTVHNRELHLSRDGGTPEPFIVKGVCYSPTPIGQSSIEDPLGSEHAAIWKRDLPRLRAMGANAIRVYGTYAGPSPTTAKDFLEAAWNGDVHPVYTLLSSWIEPCTFVDDGRTQQVVERYRQLATAYGNEPAVMGFTIGSEFNNGADTAARKAMPEGERHRYWDNFKLVIDAVRQQVGGRKIITSGLIEGFGGSEFLDQALDRGVTLDVWGFDLYRTIDSLDQAWQSYETRFSDHGLPPPPMLVGEYGAPASLHVGGGIQELPPGTGDKTLGALNEYLGAAWGKIAAHGVGGFVFEWSDEWWKQRTDCSGACRDDTHDASTATIDYFPKGGGFRDEEWFGLNAVLPGQPNELRPRAAYFYFAGMWGRGSGLAGTYVNAEARSTLRITHANDQNGQFDGELTVTEGETSVTLAVNGHYHFLSGRGPETTLAFWAMRDDGPSSIYEAWAGQTSRSSYAILDGLGVRTILNADRSLTTPVPGQFVRSA